MRNVKGELRDQSNKLTGKKVMVYKPEEKGTDVNLASNMLYDCFSGKCDVPVLLSNDLDFLEPIKIIKKQLKKPVGLVTPSFNKRNAVRELIKYSSFHRKISKNQLKHSQFPKEMKDDKGVFFCPKQWSTK